MGDEVMKIRETTQPLLSGYLVGVSNIWERDHADGKGGTAPRVAATLSITDPASRETRREDVVAGSIVALGADRYCVVAVEEGQASPGSVSLSKTQ